MNFSDLDCFYVNTLLVCLLSIWRQRKRSGLECGEVTFPILGCHWSLKWIALFDDKIPYYPFPIPSHTSTTCGGITRHVMGQIRVNALPFLSNKAAPTPLCSVLSFIALEAETHSRCDLPGLLQGHSQVEVLWLACGDPKVSKGGGLSLQINPNFSLAESSLPLLRAGRNEGVCRRLCQHLVHLLASVMKGQHKKGTLCLGKGTADKISSVCRAEKQCMHSAACPLYSWAGFSFLRWVKKKKWRKKLFPWWYHSPLNPLSSPDLSNDAGVY